jgi:UDP:flavonoid glycosyltransferase YjiC (YdhE family)
LGLPSVAEALHIPYRYIAFTPQMLPSRQHPCIAFRHQGMPGWLNRLGWKTVRQIDRFNLTRRLNRRRGRLGLAPVRDLWTHMLGTEPVVACDRLVASIPADVEVPGVQTGYMHLRQNGRDLPELEEFLAAGPPPVFAGFGSMPQPDQARLVPLIVRAARLSGQRVIVGRFWKKACGQGSGGDVFYISRYPHEQLFPRMRAVLHHGGAGTTATAAVSGVPQIIVPHVLDQYYWGEQVFRAGLGPKPVWRSRLTARKLADAIRACLSNPRLAQRAQAVGRQIGRGDGVRDTIRAIAS